MVSSLAEQASRVLVAVVGVTVRDVDVELENMMGAMKYVPFAAVPTGTPEVATITHSPEQGSSVNLLGEVPAIE
jgi:hypothetical protein